MNIYVYSDPIQCPPNVSKNFKDFIRKILNKDPNQRITIQHALLHPWVQGLSDEAVAKDKEKKRNSLLNQQIAPYLQQFTRQTRLKQEIARLLAENMTAKTEKQIEAHFNRLDTNKDHKLDVSMSHRTLSCYLL